VATVAAADRNLLWLLFTDPYLRELMPDWEFTSLHNVASFRAQAGPRLGDSPFCHLVERLLQSSDAFAAAWENRDIQALTSRERVFCHPDVGDLRMEQHSLTPGRSSRTAPGDLHPRAEHRHPHTAASATRQPNPTCDDRTIHRGREIKSSSASG